VWGGADKKWKGNFWFCFAVTMYALYYTLAKQCKFNYHINMSSGKKLGENLRKWRLKKNMSQGDLATALSVDRAYISNIENGRMNPTLSTLEKIAGALGISTSELLK
jgi:DNA-binding XRE family transcriptional regulator